jgi:hypothetical protein
MEALRLWQSLVIVGKSTEATVLPNLAIGSLMTPSPHPTSKIRKPDPTLLTISEKILIRSKFKGRT